MISTAIAEAALRLGGVKDQANSLRLSCLTSSPSSDGGGAGTGKLRREAEARASEVRRKHPPLQLQRLPIDPPPHPPCLQALAQGQKAELALRAAQQRREGVDVTLPPPVRPWSTALSLIRMAIVSLFC